MTNVRIDVLQQAQLYYQRLDAFRRERERNKRYTYGDQWCDVVDVDGRRISEEQYIKEQGSIPLKNNLIRRLVRNVIGIYNSQSERPACVPRDPAERKAAVTMDALMQYNEQLNRLSALYTRSMEEFLISGMVVHRKSYGRRGRRTDCWTDYVQPNNFFVDSMTRDFRGWDCRCVGELHKVPFADVCMMFARDEEHRAWLRGVFAAGDDDAMCTVTEVWRREPRRRYLCHDLARGSVSTVDAEQLEAMRLDNPSLRCRPLCDEVWHYYFLAPGGEVLSEGDSPYAHGGHPYVFKAYPMIDGEVHSFVADVIDQQRHTNRLITLYDWIMRSSAKGVLLVPEDCVPRGCNPADFADAWSRYNGVIFYRPSAQGAVPQQVSSNSSNVGIKDLLDLQLRFFEDISGVNSALQGKTGNVAMSAALYGQQTHNATTTLLDIMDTFNEFVRDAMYMDMSNIRQYYPLARIRSIVGSHADIDALQDVEFDLMMTPVTTTQAYKDSNNALLLEIWKSGQITLEQMLHAGNFPFADKLRSVAEAPQQP